MRVLASLYRFMERTLFNSLLKKILGCIIPLLALLLVSSFCQWQLVRALQGSGPAPSAPAGGAAGLSGNRKCRQRLRIVGSRA